MDSDRRSGIDRRKQTGFNMRTLLGDGERRCIRRQEDGCQIYLVDQYSPVLFVTIVGILFLSVTDAILTLFLLNHGASEVNPLMAYLLNFGPYAFFVPKYVLTVFGIFCLLIFRDVVVQRFKASTYTILFVLA